MSASPTLRRLPVLAAFVAALLMLAVPRPAHADPDDTALDQRRVAMQMANSGDLIGAGEYLERGVEKLADGDREKDDNLRLAARLFHHAGDLDRSWRAMVNAGVAAYRMGDAERAAHDLVDATVVAVQAGNSSRAWDTAEKVGYVLRTTDLLPDERLAILERIRYHEREATQG